MRPDAGAGHFSIWESMHGLVLRLENGILAPPNRIEGLDDLEQVLRVPRIRVGPEVERAVVLDGSRDGKGGEVVLDAQPQGDIRLVVLQDDVVLRLVLLDQVVLEEKGLFLVPRQDDGDIVDVPEEPLGLAVLPALP